MRGSIEKRGKTWSIRLTLADPRTGKRKQKRQSGFKTKREAQSALAKIISEYENNEYVEPNKLTVAEYLLQWFSAHRNNLAKTTAQRYEGIIEQHIIPAIGHIPLQRLSAVDIQKFLDKERKCGRKDNKKSHAGELSPASVHYTYRVLRCALNRAEALQLIPRNPITGVLPPTVRKTKPVLLPREQVLKLLRGLQGSYLYLPSYLAVYTGMRLGEVLGLSWDNVNLDNGTAVICQSLPYQTNIGEYYFKSPKTDTSIRTIALPPSVVETLLGAHAEYERLREVNAEIWTDYKLVCCKEDGMPLHPPTVSSGFRKAASKLGLKISFHDLRDIYAGLSLVYVGEGLKTISSNLGHGSGGLTLDRYTGMLDEIQIEAAKRYDQYLSDNNQKD